MRALVIVVLLVGCLNDTDDRPSEDVSFTAVPFAYEYANGINWTFELDVLVVVDSSPAMAEHRERLLESYARFASELELTGDTMLGVLPDLHFAVLTADPGDGGAFRTSPLVAGDYLFDVPASSIARTHNHAGDLEAAITSLTDAGAGGSAAVQPIAAAQLALERPSSFHRPDVPLLVVFISASDDASPIAIDDAVAMLAAHGVEAVAVIGGAADGACAAPATRLRALAAGFPDGSAFRSLCASDPAAALEVSHRVYRSNLAQPCLPSIRTTAECTFTDVYDTTTGPMELVLRPCSVGSPPCWRLASQFNCEEGAIPEVVRTDGVVRGTRTVGQCLLD